MDGEKLGSDLIMMFVIGLAFNVRTVGERKEWKGMGEELPRLHRGSLWMRNLEANKNLNHNWIL